MKIIRGYKSYYYIQIIFNICEIDCVINPDSNDDIILKLSIKLRSSELVSKRGPDFIKKVWKFNFLMGFTLYNNQPK